MEKDTNLAGSLLEGLGAASAPLSSSAKPGSIDMTIEGRVQRLHDELDFSERGSCNPPWSAWDS
ncbi:hypothetical protein [Actinomadura spongiicola]|uniref:hypothetical protein n=1 Tax=Actinomadura spongiicola TaxID=2303421 RepID=UPI0011C1CADE|nr:hypothetical protein [Actinomadura spongiicola]